MKIRLVFVGKTRRPEVRALVEDYLSRLRHFAEVDLTELREDSAASQRKLVIPPGALMVLLDAEGKTQSSAQFARWLGATRDHGTRELVFLCGAAEGFSDTLRARAAQKLALSSLTFSHELARVMLVEQLYRGFATLAGHPYPK